MNDFKRRLKVAKLAAQIISASHSTGSAPHAGDRVASDFREVFKVIDELVGLEEPYDPTLKEF